MAPSRKPTARFTGSATGDATGPRIETGSSASRAEWDQVEKEQADNQTASDNGVTEANVRAEWDAVDAARGVVQPSSDSTSGTTTQ